MRVPQSFSFFPREGQGDSCSHTMMCSHTMNPVSSPEFLTAAPLPGQPCLLVELGWQKMNEFLLASEAKAMAGMYSQ